ncbi:MAG: hypothetical protein U0903_01805 [Planctomycetales bacterium]
MKLFLNLLIPLALAFVAGVLNYAALSRKTALQSYVGVSSAMKVGDPYKLPLLQEVKVPAAVPGAIPWKEKEVLLTLRAPRKFEPGDWVMRSDILPADNAGLQLEKDEVALNVSLEGIVIEPKLLRIGQPLGFVVRKGPSPKNQGGALIGKDKTDDKPDYQIVGPFRLVTLGELATHEAETENPEGVRPPKTISVAVRSGDGKALNEDSQLLAKAIEQTSITAIILYPTAAPKVPKEKAAPEKEDSKAKDDDKAK